MDNIEINKGVALDQIYESMKKSNEYLEVKIIIPKIKENFKDIKPLGKFTVNNVGALEMAYMIEVLEKSICTLRQQDPKVEEAEKMLKNEFKTKNKTIYTEEKD